jgi:hypothetical protein
MSSLKESLNKFCSEAGSPSGAKAPLILWGLMYGLKPVPFN